MTVIHQVVLATPKHAAPKYVANGSSSIVDKKIQDYSLVSGTYIAAIIFANTEQY